MKRSRAIVIPDVHVPLHDQRAINCVFKAIDLVKPDRVILMGDIGEWGSVSPWKYKAKKRPPLEFYRWHHKKM